MNAKTGHISKLATKTKVNKFSPGRDEAKSVLTIPSLKDDWTSITKLSDKVSLTINALKSTLHKFLTVCDETAPSTRTAA